MIWKDLLQIPAILIAFTVYFPIANYFIGILFPILDAMDPERIAFLFLVKLMIAAIPFVIVIGLLKFVIRAATESEQPGPQYVRRY